MLRILESLNQSQGGIYMSLRRLSGIKEHGSSGTHRVAGVGLGLQHGAAAALDLVCAGREPDEEGIDVRADLLCRAVARQRQGFDHLGFALGVTRRGKSELRRT